MRAPAGEAVGMGGGMTLLVGVWTGVAIMEISLGGSLKSHE